MTRPRTFPLDACSGVSGQSSYTVDLTLLEPDDGAERNRGQYELGDGGGVDGAVHRGDEVDGKDHANRSDGAEGSAEDHAPPSGAGQRVER